MSETRFPPHGTKCTDCGCCLATVYAGNAPICWECDEGKPCKGKSRPVVDLGLPETSIPATTVISHVPPNNFEEEKVPTRISDEIRHAIQSAPESMKNTELQKKYNLSSATVSVIRRGLSWDKKKDGAAPTGGGRKVKAKTPAKMTALAPQASSLPLKASGKLTLTIDVDERGLDAFWSHFTAEDKLAAVRAAFMRRLEAQ